MTDLTKLADALDDIALCTQNKMSHEMDAEEIREAVRQAKAAAA